MKKVLVVLLSLCMVLGCFTFASASSFDDVADDNANLAAIEVLSGLKVLEGDGNGKFRPADGLKRSEACVVAVKLLGYGDFAADQTATSFSDVPASHWASGWVKFACDLGLVEGYGDGTFGPDDQLTYNQWLTIVMRALGYKDDKLVGDWPTNFVVKAKQTKLVDATLTGDKATTRAEMAQVAYNALDDKDVKYNALTNAEELGAVNYFLTCMGYTKAADTVVNGTAAEFANVQDYVGQVGDVYYNAKGEAVAVAPKAGYETYEGVWSADVLKVGTTKYNLPKADVATLYAYNADESATYNTVFQNGFELTVVGKYDASAKAFTEVVSVMTWVRDGVEQLTAGDVKQITKDIAAAVKADAKATTFAISAGSDNLYKDDVYNIDEVKDAKALDVLSQYYQLDGDTVAKAVLCDKTVAGKVTKFVAATHTATINGEEYVDSASCITGPTATAGEWYLADEGDIVGAKTAAITTTYYGKVGATKAAVAEVKEDPETMTEAKAAVPGKVSLLVNDASNFAIYNVAKNANLNGLTLGTDTDFVAEYALNEAGEIIYLDEVSPNNASAKILKSNGIYDNKYTLASDCMIVVGSKANYTADSIQKGVALGTGAVDIIVDGKVVYLELASAYAPTSESAGVFNGVEENVLDGEDAVYTVDAIVDGAAASLKSDATFSVDLTKLYVFTTDSKGLTTAVAQSPDYSFTVAAVEGNLVKGSTTNYYDVEGAVVLVAVKDGATITGWTVGSMEDVAVDAVVELYAINTVTKDADFILVK